MAFECWLSSSSHCKVDIPKKKSYLFLFDFSRLVAKTEHHAPRVQLVNAESALVICMYCALYLHCCITSTDTFSPHRKMTCFVMYCGVVCFNALVDALSYLYSWCSQLSYLPIFIILLSNHKAWWPETSQNLEPYKVLKSSQLIRRVS